MRYHPTLIYNLYMAKTNRKTLKEYFGKGKKPDSSQFADLVDSMLNIVDDGFSKSPERGMLLSPLNNEGSVIEIRRHILDGNSAWVVSLGEDEQLHIHRGLEEKAMLTLHQNGNVTLGENGKVNLQVNGSIQADYFTGAMQGSSLANGQWHTIIEKEYGCKAYQIVAACGLKSKGKYAVSHVTAMHCFGQNGRIRGSQSWYGVSFNRIQFRWRKDENKCCELQVRTRRDYGEGVMIHYQITPLLTMDFVTKTGIAE